VTVPAQFATEQLSAAANLLALEPTATPTRASYEQFTYWTRYRQPAVWTRSASPRRRLARRRADGYGRLAMLAPDREGIMPLGTR